MTTGPETSDAVAGSDGGAGEQAAATAEPAPGQTDAVEPIADGGRRWLPRLAVGTTVLTGVLILLGIWTAVAGYGLTCEGRWPLCDGFLGLFPANFGSFVEWFHRLVAMVAGFAILGTTAATWRAGTSRRIRTAFTAAVLLTPFQVVLGGLTVTRYERLILAAHFGTALVILTLLVLGTVWLVARPLPPVRTSAIGAGGALAAGALTPGFLVGAHSVGVHVGYYALALAAFAALLALATSPARDGGSVGSLAAGGALLIALGMLVGRVRLDPTGQTLVAAGLLLAGLLAAGAVWSARRRDRRPDRVDAAER